MSHLIAGIDESLRPGSYLLCAAVVSTADRHELGQMLRGLLLPRQRRLHAKTESLGRRRMLLKALAGFPGIRCHVVAGPLRRDGGREWCLRTLTSSLIADGVKELFIERVDEGTALRDQEIIAEVSLNFGASFDWRHESPEHEPLLWVADLVVSAYGHGGELRKAAEPVTASVTRS